MHRKLARSVAQYYLEVAGTALVGLEFATPGRQPPLEFARFHESRVFHTFVEVNRSVE